MTMINMSSIMITMVTIAVNDRGRGDKGDSDDDDDDDDDAVDDDDDCSRCLRKSGRRR